MQQAKVENLQRLYEIDDHPERRQWLDKLLSFMEERGTPISQCPTISKNPLDLYRLYMFTKDRGGFVEVGTTKGRAEISLISECPHTTKSTKRAIDNFLARIGLWATALCCDFLETIPV